MARASTLRSRPGIRRRRLTLAQREAVLALALVAPASLVVAGIYVYPAIATLVYSVSELDTATLAIERFVGLENFADALASPAFREAALRTVYFGVMVVLVTMSASFLVALLLNQRFVGRGALRAIVLLPWALPPIVSGVLWGQMFNADFGFINGLLRAFGADGDVLWLGNPTLALHALIVAESWRWIPFATLFILAGLQTVPKEIYEAAALDGARPRTQFRLMTVPLIGPVLVPVMIFLFVWAMKAFDTIFVLTRGGPAGGTTTLNYLVYRQGFDEFAFGQAAATAYLLTLLTLLVIALVSLPRRRRRIKGGFA